MWIAQHHSWNEEKVMAKNGMTKSTSFQNTALPVCFTLAGASHVIAIINKKRKLLKIRIPVAIKWPSKSN